MSTGGRAIHCKLPPDLTNEQRQWTSDRLPQRAKLTRKNERATLGPAPVNDESDSRLDSLRTVTQQITEKKLELFELEQSVSKLRLEQQQLDHVIEERRKHAASFAGSFTDLWTAVEKKFTKTK